MNVDKTIQLVEADAEEIRTIDPERRIFPEDADETIVFVQNEEDPRPSKA